MKYIKCAVVFAFIICVSHLWLDASAKAVDRFDFSAVPQALLDAKTTEQVRPFLGLSCPIEERIIAVRRLGEIDDPSATTVLMETFENEPPHHGVDNFPIIKQEILKALGKKTGDARPKQFLWDVLNASLARGPETKVHFWADPEYLYVVIGTIESLTAFADDRILAKFDGLASSDALKWSISQKAREGELRVRMKKAGIEDLNEKAVDYLIPLLTGIGEGQAGAWVPGKPGVKTPRALQNDAVIRILSDVPPELIPYLESKLVESADELQKHKNDSIQRSIANIRLRQKNAAQTQNAALGQGRD